MPSLVLTKQMLLLLETIPTLKLLHKHTDGQTDGGGWTCKQTVYQIYKWKHKSTNGNANESKHPLQMIIIYSDHALKKYI